MSLFDLCLRTTALPLRCSLFFREAAVATMVRRRHFSCYALDLLVYVHFACACFLPGLAVERYEALGDAIREEGRQAKALGLFWNIKAGNNISPTSRRTYVLGADAALGRPSRLRQQSATEGSPGTSSLSSEPRSKVDSQQKPLPVSQSTPLTPPAPIPSRFQHMEDPVPITVLPHSQDKGVCLDGSPPAYHLSPGIAENASIWLIFLEGGGWCSQADCVKTASSALGSSKHMEEYFDFTGIFSSRPEKNPSFYSWTRVVFRYCDGASFSGTAGKNFSGTNVTSDGVQVFRRLVRHMLAEQKMEDASHILLAGSSAGGLATLLRCDDLSDLVLAHRRERMAKSTQLPTIEQPIVKCLSDGGYFADLANYTGQHQIRNLFTFISRSHKMALNPKCLEEAGDNSRQAELCVMPENFVSFLTTPVFLVNALYDYWIIRVNTVFDHSWDTCDFNLTLCDSTQMQYLNSNRQEVINTIQQNMMKLGQRRLGLFITSCHAHGITRWTWSWSETPPKVDNATADVVIKRWFFGHDGNVQQIDYGVFGSNPSCRPRRGKDPPRPK